MDESAPQEDRKAVGLLDKVAWLLFCGTCIQLAFLQPSVLLVPGERTNLFSGLLCAATVLGALLVAKKRRAVGTVPELLASVGLLSLGIASAVLNSPPWSSMFRVLVLLASGLGGFWCARILLNSTSRVNAFAWLCTGILLAQALAALWGYHLYGQIERFIYTNPHPVIGMMFVLSFGPLALICSRNRLVVAAGILTAAVTYLALFAAGVQVVSSGMLIPLVLVIFVALLQRWGSRQAAGLLILVMVIAGFSTYFVSYLSPKNYSNPFYQAYRIESYPFAWHVAEKHPLFGIGLRSQREQYLSDYSLLNPHLTKTRFLWDLNLCVTYENTFLTFMAGLGLPFLALYVVALAAILVKLVRVTFRGLAHFSIQPWVLLVPILGGLLHSLVVDTLLYPQIAWFFSVLLGLVPTRVPARAVEEVRRRFSAADLGWTVGAVALGVVLGTHPALSPERLPSAEQLREYVKNVPIVKTFVVEKVPAPSADSTAAPQPHSATPHPKDRPVLKRDQTSVPGKLAVNLNGHEASVPWALLLILDNSQTMLPSQNTHHIDGKRIAQELVSELARNKPPGCAVSLRDFAPEIMRRAGKKVPIKVTHVVWPWVDSTGDTSQLPLLLETRWTGENDLRPAITHASRTDFRHVQQRNRRVALITDGLGDRVKVASLDSMLKACGKEKVVLDVIAIGMKSPDDEEYTRLVQSEKGIFLRLSVPEQVVPTVGDYLRLLARAMPPSVEIFGSSGNWTLDRGAAISLAPGSYSVLLPRTHGLALAQRIVDDVKISSGMTTLLDIEIADRRVRVRRSDEPIDDSASP